MSLHVKPVVQRPATAWRCVSEWGAVAGALVLAAAAAAPAAAADTATTATRPRC